MAELDHFHASDDADAQTTSLTYVNISSAMNIDGTGLTANQDYLMLFWMGVGGSSGVNVDYEFRVTDDAGTELSGSYNRQEPRRVSIIYGHPYFFMDRVTTDSSPGDYDQEFKSLDAAQTSRCSAGSALAVAIGNGDDQLKENEDIFWDEDNTLYSSLDNSGFTDGASVTIGDGSSDYLVFINVHVLVDSTSAAIEYRLDVGGTPRQKVSMEGENVLEEWSRGMWHYVSAPAASTVCKVQMATDSATAGAMDVDRNAICAIRLDRFEQHFGGTDSSDTSMTVQNTWVQRTANAGVTQSSGGSNRDWLGFIAGIVDVGDNNKTTQIRAVDDGTQGNFGSSHGDGGSMNYIQHGATDLKPIFWFDKEVTVADGYAWSIDIDVRETNSDLSPNPVLTYSSHAFMSTELTPASSNFPYHVVERERRRDIKTLLTF